MVVIVVVERMMAVSSMDWDFHFDGDAIGVADGFGATTFTPLPQTSFLPLLIQVYLKPLAIEVEFNLEQEAPVFTAANAGADTVEANREKHSKNNIPCILRRFTDVIFDSP